MDTNYDSSIDNIVQKHYHIMELNQNMGAKYNV
jgi:hypothetical protein